MPMRAKLEPAMPMRAKLEPAMPMRPEPEPAVPMRAKPEPALAASAEPLPAPTAGLATTESLTPVPRLPIYDAVESDWFRHSGKPILADSRPESGSWTSPADEGFRAASAVATPTAGEATSVGLPKRVPQANLVPGSVGHSREVRPRRPAEHVRNRLADLQRGARQGRSDAPWNFGVDER
jgi:hypothetical protein